MSSKRKRSTQRRAASPAQAGARQQAVATPRAAAPKPRAQPRPQPAQTAAAGVAEAPLDRYSLGAAGAVGLIALIVYLLTVDPSVPNGDSGELITSAYVWGVAHPPGYPLITMLGHVASWLPFGSPALRVNLLSCVFDAAAVSVVFLVVYRFVGTARVAATAGWQRWAPYASGAVGALLLAFSTLFWQYSVVAEVFALNNLFAAVLLMFALEWSRRPERTRLLWAFAFVFGLSLCNQQTIVTLVPAFLVLLWAGWTAGARRVVRLRDIAIAFGLFVAGLLPYLYLPLAARGDPVMNWADPSSVGRFFDVVTRASYGSRSLTVGGESGTIGEQLRLLSTTLTGAFVGGGIVLALLGLWWAWRRRRKEGLALLVAVIVSGPVFVAYANPAYPNELTKGVIARFYILPSIPIAMLAGLGAWWILVRVETLRWPRLRPGLAAAIAAAGLLLLPVTAAAVHYNGADQSNNYVGLHYAQDLLEPLAPNALLLMRGDENYTTVNYAQYVTHLRPDVVALDTELLKLPSYIAQKKLEHPGVAIPFTTFNGSAKALDDLVSANLGQRPVYYVGAPEHASFGSPFDQQREGLARRLLTKGTATDQYALLERDPGRFERLRYPLGSYPKTSWEAAIAEDYGGPAFDVAFALQRNGSPSDLKEAEKMYRAAIRLAPNEPSAYKNLGLILRDNGGDPKEIIAVWDRFLQLKPDDPQASEIRRVVASLKAKS